MFQVESPTGASLSKMSSAPTSPTQAVGCSAWPTRGSTPTSLSCESRSSCSCLAAGVVFRVPGVLPKSCAVSRSSGHKVVHSQIEHQHSRKGAKSAGRTAFFSGYNRQNQECVGARRHAGLLVQCFGRRYSEAKWPGRSARNTTQCVWVVVGGKALGCLVSCFRIE